MAYLDPIRARLNEKNIWDRIREKLGLRRRLLRASIKLRSRKAIHNMATKSREFPAINTTPKRLCKVCRSPVELVGTVDFNKSCETSMGIHIGSLAVPITYVACPNCRFVFTEDLDIWTHDDFRKNIYNLDYKIVDPDYDKIRPRGIAKKLTTLLEDFTDLRILDYGGGNGLFAKLLKANGFSNVAVYDPFSPQHATLPDTKFDLVTCFETLEHVPDPTETMKRLLSFVDDGGAVIFSTFLRGREFESQGLSWWYIAPRNGHISIFSPKALEIILGEIPFSSSQADETMHVAWRGEPKFFSPALCKYFNIHWFESKYAPRASLVGERQKITWRDLIPYRYPQPE